MTFVCPHCRVFLFREMSALRCGNCSRLFPIERDIADFSEGEYYDSYDAGTVLTDDHRAGLEGEFAGTRQRLDDFYLPLLRAKGARRVLDVGCGNGLAVDLFDDAAIEGWGIDLSQLRKWQWQLRRRRDRLAVADALRLPFSDGYFDHVISSGVIEHIGVSESGGASYSVAPLQQRDLLRARFISELLRVLAPSGRLFLDFPNGAFPIDFWHGTEAGGARWHWPGEGFLPKYRQILRLVDESGGATRVRAIAPHNRLQCRQVGRHWYGQLFRLPVVMFLRLMTVPPFTFLAASPLNPYLVIEITK